MFGASLSRAGRAALAGSAVTTSRRWVSLRTFYAMIPVLIPAATAAVAILTALVAEAALVVDAARVEAALVAGAICHRPTRNRQSDKFQSKLKLKLVRRFGRSILNINNASTVKSISASVFSSGSYG